MKSLEVDLGNRSYPIYIGENLLQDSTIFAKHIQGHLSIIVTNPTISKLYGQQVESTLKNIGQKVVQVIIPEGEEYKTWQTLQLIFDGLMSAGADRKSTIFALGGGVVGDMAGFAAASFMRGINFVQIPSTLLSQVDSSVGGKTGINHPLGKNMIGAFHQPVAVIADLGTLKTLPPKELAAGLAEVIKHGAIADANFLNWIESNISNLNACEIPAMEHAVLRSCEIKSSVVAADEKELGIRAHLNFGHTFGHAIEAGMGYGQWLHGEAVGCGMVIASEVSKEMGYINSEEVQRLTEIISQLHLPIKPPQWSAKKYLELMAHDKKAEQGEIKYILLKELGQAIVQKIPNTTIENVLYRFGALK